MYIVYGIPNCNTVKKTFTWLNTHHIPFTFHNYKTAGITTNTLKKWCQQTNWSNLLNKKSATWRELSKTLSLSVTNEKVAIKIMAEYTSIIKRPIIEKDGIIIVIGFDENEYQKLFLA